MAAISDVNVFFVIFVSYFNDFSVSDKYTSYS